MKLKEHESHYATHDLELESIVHALKMWRHYLMGKKVRVEDKPQWSKIFIWKTNFKCQAKQVVRKMVDALSKRVHELHATTISMYQSDLKDKILRLQNEICNTWK
jgi:hypothetical protein